MRVGTICFASDQGLGILAKAFRDHGIVTDVLVVRHGSRPTHEDWHPGATIIHGCSFAQERRTVLQFCEKMDRMLFFETPFYWEAIYHCRSKGVKTYLMTMYECMPPVSQLPYQPDRFLCPSTLDLRYFPDRSVYIPVPVEVPWHQRLRARVFIHNAGHGGLRGRNGTQELLDAMEFVRSPIKLIVRSQKGSWSSKDPRVEFRSGTIPYGQLWEEGDCLCFPERFNGLSLPLQEARAAGMLVMTSDRTPMNEWLPREPLIRVAKYARSRVSGRCVEFDEAVIDPRDIAAQIDRWFDQDIEAYSLSGKAWAETMSWNALGIRYAKELSN